MQVLEQIQQAAADRGLRFIVIGGFAVIEHGYARMTADLDLLIRRVDRQEWRTLLADLSYGLVHDGDTFLQFSRTDQADWPVDLMLVHQETFDGLYRETKPCQVHGVRIQLVSLSHLLALKLHVLKQARLHRFLKDFQDVIELIRLNKIDLRSDAIRDLFLRYGNEDLYEKIKRACLNP